ncbi:MAG: hypothetical protein MUC87_05115 [Bacteroidia bacterium]|jgi:hypothetical protein|nr:hypothetical protein [Bacteroidia bacterium]
MNNRTGQTLSLRELLPQALGGITIVSPGSVSAADTDVSQQDEAGGPVRPAVRVPLSASHYQPLHRLLSPSGSSSGIVSDEQAWAAAG